MAEVAAPRLKRPATLDHLKKKKPLERQVPVVLSDEPVEAIQEARKRVAVLRTEIEAEPEDSGKRAKLEMDLAGAEAALDAALEAADEDVVWVRFRSIGRKAYEALVDAHPPKEEQIEEAKEHNEENPVYNGTTFCPALISACAIEPKISIEDAEGFFDEWNFTETMGLFMAAMECCSGRRVVDLGNVYGGTQG